MPTIDIPDKICPHCGGTKWSLRTYNKLSSCGERYKTYICYQCELIRCRIKRRQYVINYPDKIKASSKKNYIKVKSNPVKYQKALESTKKLKAEKRYTHLDKLYRNRSMNNLTDNYIKRLVIQDSNLVYLDVTPELIELKRKQLILTRQIKNNGKDQSSNNSN